MTVTHISAHTLRMRPQNAKGRAKALATRIAELKHELGPKIAELRKLEKEFDAVWDEKPESAVEEKKKPGRKPSEESIPSRVLAYFRKHPGEHHVDDIENGVGAARQSLLSALLTLKKEGKLVSPKRAVYAQAVTNILPLPRSQRICNGDE